MDNEKENYIANLDKLNPVLSIQLKEIGIDMSSVKDARANDLKATLSNEGYKLNFDLKYIAKNRLYMKWLKC